MWLEDESHLDVNETWRSRSDSFFLLQPIYGLRFLCFPTLGQEKESKREQREAMAILVVIKKTQIALALESLCFSLLFPCRRRYVKETKVREKPRQSLRDSQARAHAESIFISGKTQHGPASHLFLSLPFTICHSALPPKMKLWLVKE